MENEIEIKISKPNKKRQLEIVKYSDKYGRIEMIKQKLTTLFK